MRRVFGLFMAIVCCCSLTVSANAMQNMNNSQIKSDMEIISCATNEYDAYLMLQNTPVTMLEESGYTAQAISELKNTSFEELLYERAQLSEDDLYRLGYESEQVRLLKEYDGSSISGNSQIRGTFADLSGEFNVLSYSTTSMKVSFVWEWSNAPVYSGSLITDIVTCGFGGNNNDNIPNTMNTVPEENDCYVYYYTGNDEDGYEYVTYDRPEVTVEKVHSEVESEFQMSKSAVINSQYVTGWARKGYLIVGIEEDNSVNELYSGTFAIGYGHTVATLSPSIDVVVGTGSGVDVGLSFGIGTEKMYYKTMIVKSSDGSFEEYEGM